MERVGSKCHSVSSISEISVWGYTIPGIPCQNFSELGRFSERERKIEEYEIQRYSYKKNISYKYEKNNARRKKSFFFSFRKHYWRFVILRNLRSAVSLGTSGKLGILKLFEGFLRNYVGVNELLYQQRLVYLSKLKDKGSTFACQDNILLGHTRGYKVAKQMMATLFRDGECVGF